jgi:SAM-dependent methyltransferase
MGIVKLKSKIPAAISYYFLNSKKKKEELPNSKELELNEALDCYPRNHNYTILNKKLYPSFKLYERFRYFDKFVPEDVESFLDIGCSKGFYVLKTAEKKSCKISVGIDLHKPFIDISNKVNDYLKYDNVKYSLSSVSDVETNLEKFDGPFQTVLLIGTYHYLFWGSGYCADAYFSHDKILSMLSKICTGQILFSGRLEIVDLPRDARKIALENKDKVYTTKEFLKCAGKYFNIEKVGSLGKYPLFVMKVK